MHVLSNIYELCNDVRARSIIHEWNKWRCNNNQMRPCLAHALILGTSWASWAKRRRGFCSRIKCPGHFCYDSVRAISEGSPSPGWTTLKTVCSHTHLLVWAWVGPVGPCVTGYLWIPKAHLATLHHTYGLHWPYFTSSCLLAMERPWVRGTTTKKCPSLCVFRRSEIPLRRTLQQRASVGPAICWHPAGLQGHHGWEHSREPSQVPLPRHPQRQSLR